MNKFAKMKKEFFITIVTFVFAIFSSSIAQTTSHFPQDRVDKAIYEHWQNKDKIDLNNCISKEPLSFDFRENIISLEKTILPDKESFGPNSLKDNLFIVFWFKGNLRKRLFIFSCIIQQFDRNI